MVCIFFSTLLAKFWDFSLSDSALQLMVILGTVLSRSTEKWVPFWSMGLIPMEMLLGLQAPGSSSDRIPSPLQVPCLCPFFSWPTTALRLQFLRFFPSESASAPPPQSTICSRATLAVDPNPCPMVSLVPQHHGLRAVPRGFSSANPIPALAWAVMIRFWGWWLPKLWPGLRSGLPPPPGIAHVPPRRGCLTLLGIRR